MAKRTKVTPKKVATTRTPKKKQPKPKAKAKKQGTCFVMMPLKDPFAVYYEAIFKPAIVKAKLAPVRADDLFRPSVIVSDLWKMIQDAEVLLAELTAKNANVFYELGLAHAIGKPVILVSETMDDVPFDLQQLRVLLYDKNDPAWGEKLSDSITNALQETLDKPVEAVPSIFRKTVASQAPEQDATAARIEALEGQMRRLRAQGSRQKHLFEPWADELESVHGPSQLTEWATRWHERGVSIRALQVFIRQYGNIPSEEAERIATELTD